MKHNTKLGIGIADIRTVDDDGKPLKAYVDWRQMLHRAYNPKYHASRPSYVGCSVVKSWHVFSNFKRWHDQSYVIGYHLDKDILKPGNKTYGPDLCEYIPPHINSLIGKKRVSDLPPGVRNHPLSKQKPELFGDHYIAQIFENGVQRHIGCFVNIEDAARAYRKRKSEEVRRVAMKSYLNEEISEDVYHALTRSRIDTKHYWNKVA